MKFELQLPGYYNRKGIVLHLTPMMDLLNLLRELDGFNAESQRV